MSTFIFTQPSHCKHWTKCAEINGLFPPPCFNLNLQKRAFPLRLPVIVFNYECGWMDTGRWVQMPTETVGASDSPELELQKAGSRLTWCWEPTPVLPQSSTCSTYWSISPALAGIFKHLLSSLVCIREHLSKNLRILPLLAFFPIHLLKPELTV